MSLAWWVWGACVVLVGTLAPRTLEGLVLVGVSFFAGALWMELVRRLR